MDENQNNKRRDRIKTILIFFLAILLVLTFFSNTIMNYTLPTVTTYNAYPMQITEKIRGSSTVISKQESKIKATGSRKVSSVNVKVGDTVQKGDLIMTLDASGNNDAVKTAEEALRTAEVDYQKALLKAAPDYSDDTTGIARAREDLQMAINELDEARRKQNTQISEDAYKEASRKSTEASAKQKTLNDYLTSISSENYDDIPARYGSSLLSASSSLQNAQDTYDKAKAEYEELSNSVSSGTPSSGGSDDGLGGSYDLESYERKIEEKEIEVARAKEDYINCSDPSEELEKKRAWEDKELELKHLHEDQQKAKDAAEEAKKAEQENKERQQELASAKQDMEDAKAQLTYATTSKNQTIASVKRMINDDIEALQKEIDSAKEIIDAYSNQKNDSISTLEAAVTTKQRDLEDRIRKLNQTKEKDQNDTKTEALDLETKRLEVEKKKDELKAAEEKSGTVKITANNQGVISELNVAAGDDAPDGTSLVTINLTTAGFSMEMAVDAEQAKKVRVGTAAEVRGLNSDAKAVLTGIRSDTANSKGKILVFDLTGDSITPGETAELVINCSSQNYDLVVPNSAIQNNEKGKFVLVARSRSTPLGNRYYASRVEVKVLAHDEQYSAVQGELNSGDAVIKTAERLLSNGEQIRLEDTR